MSKKRFGLLIGVLFVFLLSFGLYSCGGEGGGSSSNSSSSTNSNTSTTSLNQAVLGPLSDATINVYNLDNLSKSIYTTTAEKSDNITTAGTFSVNLTGLPSDEYVLVTATKGEDIDPTDSGTLGKSKKTTEQSMPLLL